MQMLLRLPVVVLVAVLLPTIGLLHADDAEKAAPPAKEKKEKSADHPVDPVVTQESVTIDGKSLDYRVTAGKLRIKKDRKDTEADIFYVSYEKSGDIRPEQRPVMFAFNGGPGSSAVWLHLGFLGPKIINIEGDGTMPQSPPVIVKDNPLSLLDVCDLVFIDPVSTGYSRAEEDKQAGEFHGVNEDIESVSEFIRRWVTEHDRWASPKFILGESYGGIRAVGVSKQLFNRYGMPINGLVMLSTLMDYGTVQSSDGNDVANQIYLPAYAAVAHYHGKVAGKRDELVARATEFAYGDYASALLKGADLDAAAADATAAQLADLTGIPASTWKKYKLRVNPQLFRAELLRDEGKTVGRFDARVAWDKSDSTSSYPYYDPSYALAYAAFSNALNDYLGRDIGYKEEQPYEILTGKVHPWNWASANSVVNVSGRLHDAMIDNPKMRVLVMSAHCDLATPPECMAYSLRRLLELPRSARSRIDTVFYDAGHMFYMNPPDLQKARADLLKFIKGD